MKIKLNINNVNWSLTHEGNNFLNNKDMNVRIYLYIFKYIKIFKFDLNKEQIEQFVYNRFVKRSTRNIGREIYLVIKDRLNREEYTKLKEIVKKYMYLMPNIDKLAIKISLGIEDSYLTSIVFGIVSTISNIVLRKIPNKQLSIRPIFNNENSIEINLNIAISMTIVRLVRLFFIYKRNIKKFNLKINEIKNV